MLSHSRRNLNFAFLSMLISGSFLAVPDLRGQGAASASLRGTVRDHSEAEIPGARLSLYDSEKGISRSVVTSSTGEYNFALLPPGNYGLKVEKSGFATYVRSSLNLSLGQSATQDIVLEVGEVQSIVSVTAAAPLLNTEDANVAAEITQRQVVEMPLNLRSPFALANLSSSVNNGPQQRALNGGAAAYGNADQDSGFFGFGGTQYGTAGYLLDGHWLGAGDWGGIMYAPSVDEVQEMKIQTNTFSAQFGWSEGNVIQVITKSGTRAFHGDAFEFHRSSVLDANLFFNNKAGIRKDSFTRDQYGVSVGGPLYLPKLYRQRDKTFIFGAFEGRRSSVPNTLVATVPTKAFAQGDFSALLGAQTGTDALGRPVLAGQIYNPFTTRTLTAGVVDAASGMVARSGGLIRDPFVGNVIPPRLIDPVATRLLPYWPAPSSSALVNNFSSSALAASATDGYTIRVDHNVSDSHRLFLRWSQKRQFQQANAPYFGTGNPAGPASIAPNNRWDAGLNYTAVLSPSLVLNFTGGWNRWQEGRIAQGFLFKPSTVGLPAFLDDKGYFPGIGIQGMFGLGSGANQSYPREVRTLAADITKTLGSQKISFGFMGLGFIMNQSANNGASFSFNSSLTTGPDPTLANPQNGFGFASFLLGTGSGGQYSISASPAISKRLYGWYVQDDVRIGARLTLNLGIRYDTQTAVRERYNRSAYFDRVSANPISNAAGFTVPGRLVYTSSDEPGLFKPSHNNWAPRIGLAWKATDRLVVRAGGGLFYVQAVELATGSFPPPGYSQATPYIGTADGFTPQNLLSNPFPNGTLQPTGNSLGGLTNVGLNVQGVNRARPTPYVEQWTFGIQYSPTSTDLIEAAYVGNHGVKLMLGNTQLNQIPASALATGSALLQQVRNPFYGLIQTSSCGLNLSTVQAGQLLRPFPEFCNVTNVQALGGASTYHALQLNWNHRWNHGLQLLASFTASKFLSNTAGVESWTSPGSNAYQDYNNLAAEKSLDGTDVPRSVVISYVYELPVGKGRKFGSQLSRSANAVVGGWQVAGVNAFKDGTPLYFTTAVNNTFSFGGGQRPNISGNPLAESRSVDRWLNPAVFSQPPPFSFGNASRYDPHARGPAYQNFDLIVSKWLSFREILRVQVRGEAFNLLNHTNFYPPNTSFGNSAFGRITQAYPSRSIQLGVKAYW